MNFNTTAEIGNIVINFDNLVSVEDGVKSSLNGKIKVGVDINSTLAEMAMPALRQLAEFAAVKANNQTKIQQKADELEMLKLELEILKVKREMNELNK